eukprot:TRINITY_DN64607_c0_g1_i2.p1 TRINITY_DN64607_c0_g1~~TRINITY_DN64607_c0_g1_i2.p1  ORF type:complete len:265 (+),score=11.42 TRINITY_DN64607_c0_g1_i2:38-832(+)
MLNARISTSWLKLLNGHNTRKPSQYLTVKIKPSQCFWRIKIYQTSQASQKDWSLWIAGFAGWVVLGRWWWKSGNGLSTLNPCHFANREWGFKVRHLKGASRCDVADISINGNDVEEVYAPVVSQFTTTDSDKPSFDVGGPLLSYTQPTCWSVTVPEHTYRLGIQRALAPLSQVVVCPYSGDVEVMGGRKRKNKVPCKSQDGHYKLYFRYQPTKWLLDISNGTITHTVKVPLRVAIMPRMHVFVYTGGTFWTQLEPFPSEKIHIA